MNKSLSIFMPVFNEGKIIGHTISELQNAIKDITEDYEILLINDGSTDDSREKILALAREDSRIRLIEHKQNSGYGAALRTGFLNAVGSIIFYTDADMPVDFREIKKVLPYMQDYDLTIGYRIDRHDKFRRYIYSKIYNFLLRVMLGVRVKDANFSFKFIRKEALERIILKAKTVFIDGELLAEAFRCNFKIKEIPLVYFPRTSGSSNFDTFKSALSTLKELIFYWIGLRIIGRQFNNGKVASRALF